MNEAVVTSTSSRNERLEWLVAELAKASTVDSIVGVQNLLQDPLYSPPPQIGHQSDLLLVPPPQGGHTLVAGADTCTFGTNQASDNHLDAPFIGHQHEFRRPQMPQVYWSQWWKAVVLSLAVVFVAGLEFCAVHNERRPTPEADRDTKIWKCAKQLSTTEGFDRQTSPRKLAVQQFLVGIASEIDVADGGCKWQSAFGIVYAILVLRESISVNHSSWHPDSKLIAPSDICQWSGIKCDVQANLQGIFLSDANLAGTIPTEIVGFAASLTTLNLCNNENLIGTLPYEISMLRHLKYLLVQETSIGGTVPSAFGSLTKLNQLFLDRTHLTGSMPSTVCDLRLHPHDLELLHADCRGSPPSVLCANTCCTTCY